MRCWRKYIRERYLNLIRTVTKRKHLIPMILSQSPSLRKVIPLRVHTTVASRVNKREDDSIVIGGGCPVDVSGPAGKHM